jgi:4-aminobutyrate aminotransferase/(S)-3-amino-2-methylpropionate transaminase
MPQKTDTNAGLYERRMRAIPRGPFNVAPIFAARAEGSRVWDVEGKEYIDFCGGIGVLNVGHNHPRVVAAVRAQLDALIHTCWHVAMYEPYLELAERLNAKVPVPGPNKACFFNSGAEAVENAIKVSRAATGR